MSKTLQSTALRTGFVVAMRAEIVTAKRTPAWEWLIVSRWGTAGEHLSIGRTKIAAPRKAAPIQLTPRQTVLASMLRLPLAADGAPTFLLSQRLPASMSLAGDFAPAEGYARLHGRGAGLRLTLEGRCVGRAILSAWRVEATREPWVGEFIENGGV